MENWYEKTKAKTEHIFDAIIKHTFVTELMQDTLDEDIYVSDEFTKAVKKVIEIANTYALTASADNLVKMEEVFIKTSQLEYMFWDSAYKQEKWAI